MSQHDTTRLVNITGTTFVFHFNKEPYELKPNEEKVWPVYIAKHGAKYMLNLLLQTEHPKEGARLVLSTLTQGPGWRDTELQASYLSQILPDWYGKNQEESAPVIRDVRDEKIKTMEETIAALQEQMQSVLAIAAAPKKKGGRPPKMKTEAETPEETKDDIA